MKSKPLHLQQLEARMREYKSLIKNPPPSTGWVKAVRTALGMTLQQLGDRLSITKQSVRDIERREAEGSVTLKTLRDTARAMDMELVYGLVPKDGSLDALIERRARELATEIVMRTSNTMKLEDQAVSEDRIRKAIRERTATLRNEMPGILWD